MKLWKEKLAKELPEASAWVQHTIGNRLLLLARWLLFSVITGGCLGLTGTFFGKSVAYVTEQQYQPSSGRHPCGKGNSH